MKTILKLLMCFYLTHRYKYTQLQNLDEVMRAIGLLEAGMRPVDVARQIGTSQSVISRFHRIPTSRQKPFSSVDC